MTTAQDRSVLDLNAIDIVPPGAPARMTYSAAFENRECSRCGGSGHYSYNPLDGTRCYGCGGTGKVYTKRGRLTRDRYESHFMVATPDLHSGMRIRVPGYTGSHTVLEARPWRDGDGGSINPATNRADAATNGDKWLVRFNGVTFHGVAADKMWRRPAAGAEEMRAALQDALDYQRTLTMRGMPRRKGARA